MTTIRIITMVFKYLNIKRIKGGKSMKLFASVLAALGSAAATVGTQGCWMWFMDEPKMPRHMLNK